MENGLDLGALCIFMELFAGKKIFACSVNENGVVYLFLL